MEYENKYASKGMAGTALGIGIGALGLEFLRGGRGGLFGGHWDGHNGHHGGGCGDRRGPMVDRFELAESQRISSLESQNAFLRAELDTQRKFGIVETQIAHLQDADRCIREEICDLRQQLRAITVTRVPQSVICPPIQATLQQAQ